MRGPFRNSDFKVNTYFKRFSAELEEAKKHGHDVWVDNGKIKSANSGNITFTSFGNGR